jgi:hypothetical protein
LAAALLALVFTVPASASPIGLVTEWNNFLAGGESEWSTTPPPPITLTIKIEMVQALESSDPLGTPMVQYLEWRRNLDPARFDHWHPEMGPVLGSLQPPTTTTTTPTVNPQPQTLPPPLHQEVPEPGTMAIGVGLVAGSLIWRRARWVAPLKRDA